VSHEPPERKIATLHTHGEKKMSDNQPEKPQVYHLVALQFAGKDRAKQVVDLARNKQSKDTFKVQAWAVVEVDDRGKAEVKQSGKGGKGAAIGAGTGILLGLIGGPAGLLVWALGGTLVGGLIGKSSGHAFDKDQLKAIAAGMVPNSSAIVAIIEDKEMEKVAADAGEMDAKIVTVTIGDQMSGEVAQFAAVDLGKDEPEEETPAAGADASAGAPSAA
jgi:uncharacterized membrane protein